MTDLEQLNQEMLAQQRRLDAVYEIMVQIRDQNNAILSKMKHCPANGSREVFDKEFHRNEMNKDLANAKP